MVIAIFNVVLISDRDENAILFDLLKYSDKLSGNIVFKIQIEMSDLYFTYICNQLHLHLSQFINLLFLFTI